MRSGHPCQTGNIFRPGCTEQRVLARTAELEAVQQDLLRQTRLATLGQLAATVSHELRNPLATLRTSFYHIARRARQQGLGVERALERIDRNITRCDHIISELLDYTRMPPLQLQRIRLDEWLPDMLHEYRMPEAIELICTLAPNLELWVDPDRFRRVLINVLDNACQAMSASSETPAAADQLQIAAEVIDNEVCMSIRDRGVGMSSEVLSHIFEPLYSTKVFGLGLGLTIVREIVRQHGGDIHITSKLGEGCRVELRLPQAPTA